MSEEQQALCAKVLAVRWGEAWQSGMPSKPYLLVPLGPERFLFVTGTAPGGFADVRRLRNGYSETIGAEVAERVIATGNPATTGFGRWLTQELLLRGATPDAAVPILHRGKLVGVMVAGGS